MDKGRYIDIPIVETAKRCGVRINNRTLGRIEVEAVCPFCGDKPKRYHLNINTKKDQYHCKLCGASGNSVSLYAGVQGISFSEAARELLGGGNIYQFPHPPSGVPHAEQEVKPLSLRHDAYCEMLSHLTLSERHINNLRERGLSDGRIAQNMYRTLPKDEHARRFLSGMLAGFYDLRGIPGFYTDNYGNWSITGKGGLLIPVCTMDGYIQGLQIRLDDEELDADTGGNNRRYRWLSSRYKDNGTKSEAWIHVTGDISSKTAFLTEGPLKGDVASFLKNDALFVCIAGINSTEGLESVIKALGVREVALAMDMDRFTNKQVREGFERIKGIVSRINGINVQSLAWDVTYKGIDDYCLAMRKAAA